MAKAPDQASSLQEIINCSICLEVLNNPVIFPCVHHFCKKCKEQLKKETQVGVTGVLCPLCQQFASDEAIKDDFVMEQIINVHNKNAGENAELSCDFCTKEKSTHKCIECKSTLCDNCKIAHIRIPTCKGHTIQPFEGTEEAVINSIVFCSFHTDKILEFNCVNCKEAICYRCKILDHDSHRTQSIEDAITAIMPLVKKKLEPIQSDITFLTECIVNLDDAEAATKNKQEEFELAIENKRVQLQQNLENDATGLDAEVKMTFQAKIKEIQMQRGNMGNFLSTKESIKSWVDTLLNHFKDVNLLFQLQGDLMTTLDQHQKRHDKITLVSMPKKELQYVHHEDNMVASFKNIGVKVLHMKEKIEALEHVEAENRKQNEKIDTLEAENRMRNNKIHTLEVENRMRNDKIDTLQVENRMKNNKIHTLEVENQTRNSKIDTLQVENRMKNNKIHTLEVENRTRNNKIHTLQVENRMRNNEIHTLLTHNRKCMENEQHFALNALKLGDQIRFKEQINILLMSITALVIGVIIVKQIYL